MECASVNLAHGANGIDSRLTLGGSLDLDDPMVNGDEAPPNRLAQDLMHMDAWREVDKRFNKFAYLDLAELNRLRHTIADAGHPGMSLADITAAVGTSPEAVQQTLRFADAKGLRNDRRNRIIRAGVRRLEHPLAAKL